MNNEDLKDKKIVFIHVPKTGGQDMKKKIVHPDIKVLSRAQDTPLCASFYHNRNTVSVIMVRHPIDRFISGFRYIIDPDNGINNPELRCHLTDINEYVNLIGKKEESDPFGMLFQKMDYWLKGDFSRLYLVLYDAEDNYRNICDLMSTLNIDLGHIEKGERVNVSRSLDGVNYTLTDKSMSVLNKYFENDLSLYEEMLNGQKKWYRLADLSFAERIDNSEYITQKSYEMNNKLTLLSMGIVDSI